MKRRETRSVKVGSVYIGSKHPISIQSMTNTRTSDVKATVDQIKELEKFGCEIIRVAVLDEKDANSISLIKKEINIPIIADIHFSAKLAEISINQGIDGLRLNPGNLDNRDKVVKLVNMCKERKIPIRIGVNGGSLSEKMLKKYGGLCAEAIVESAMNHIKILEECDFYDIKVSLKCSDIYLTEKSYRLLAEKCNYPFHIGITEAGTLLSSSVKSSIGLYMLLSQGLGDTLRVSITDDPITEIKIAKNILNSMNLRVFPELISCPTCGRTRADIIGIAKRVEDFLYTIEKPIKVAVMGCYVNGPGEAKEADIGIAGMNEKFCMLFKKGKEIRKIELDNIEKELLEEINKL